jgi:hypothetical protein
MADKEILKILDELLLCTARSVVNTGHPHWRWSTGQPDDFVVLKAGRCPRTGFSARKCFLHLV